MICVAEATHVIDQGCFEGLEKAVPVSFVLSQHSLRMMFWTALFA